MILTQLSPSGGVLGVEPVEAEMSMLDDKAEKQATAGYGRCYACEAEGKVCGGYKKPKSGSMCDNCGHNFTRHA